MFSRLAKYSTRYRLPIIIFWVALTIVLVIFSPSLSKVGITDDSQFLPKDTESLQAQALMEQKFVSGVAEPPGSALIVIFDEKGLSNDDFQEARQLYDWLHSPEGPQNITRTISIFDNEALRSTLLSNDQTTLLVNIEMSTSSSSATSRATVKDIRSHVQSSNTHAEIYVTGHGGVTTDVLISVQQTINNATVVTIILVICLLLLIYRSPVAIFVPLITIGVSYLVSRSIAGFIAIAGLHVSSLVDAYLVVTLFGIGTDYCLFMVSRFKEELFQNERQFAEELTIKRIGPVILASATTVIVALLCLGISRFGMNRTSGFVLAIGAGITLLASLTLAPALISFFGKKLFWPYRLQQSNGKKSSIWTWIGKRVTSRPLFFAIPIILILALPYMALTGMRSSASLITQMPESIDSVRGFNLVREHFSSGDFSPLHVVIDYPQGDLTGSDSLKAIKNIADSLSAVEGISSVKYYSAPSSQILDLIEKVKAASTALSAGDVSKLSEFLTLQQQLKKMVIDYPGVVKSLNFQGIVAGLTQISAETEQLKVAGLAGFAVIVPQIQQSIKGISDNLQGLNKEFNLESSGAFTDWLKENYFSQDRTLAKLDVALKTDPYSEESIDSVHQIRSALGESIQASVISGAKHYVSGESANQADILAVNSSDFFNVLLLAVAGILLVTILLLRSLIAPLYMIITVVLNFGATMGISTWLFLDILKQNSEMYMLPIFVFAILIAVGSDYNIFLVSRIREECKKKPLKEAIRESVSNTGGVITSCGIILAGTFATLTTASLQMVFQVGAAISIGVLIDTFLVRAILIPSLATLFGRWSWWPSALFKNQQKQ
jgi:putative drug exporter of the RND superfamily